VPLGQPPARVKANVRQLDVWQRKAFAMDKRPRDKSNQCRNPMKKEWKCSLPYDLVAGEV